MNGFSTKGGGFQAGNPIANALVVVVGTLAVAASIVLGFLAFVILASIIAVLAAVIGIRLWWFKRKLASRSTPNSPAPSESTIEGEYVVIERRKRDGDS